MKRDLEANNPLYKINSSEQLHRVAILWDPSA